MGNDGRYPTHLSRQGREVGAPHMTIRRDPRSPVAQQPTVRHPRRDHCTTFEIGTKLRANCQDSDKYERGVPSEEKSFTVPQCHCCAAARIGSRSSQCKRTWAHNPRRNLSQIARDRSRAMDESEIEKCVWGWLSPSCRAKRKTRPIPRSVELKSGRRVADGMRLPAPTLER